MRRCRLAVVVGHPGVAGMSQKGANAAGLMPAAGASVLLFLSGVALVLVAL